MRTSSNLKTCCNIIINEIYFFNVLLLLFLNFEIIKKTVISYLILMMFSNRDSGIFKIRQMTLQRATLCTKVNKSLLYNSNDRKMSGDLLEWTALY